MDVERPDGKLGRPVIVPGEKHTRERIFNAALDLFALDGYDRTSVRRIAREVGITESAVYRHYPSKEAILDAIFAYAESRIYTPLPVEQDIGSGGGVSIFRGLLEPLPAIIKADPSIVKIMRVMFGEMRHNEKIRRYFQKEYAERADNYLEGLFKRCIEKGVIRACDPRSLARIFNAFRSDWALTTFIIGREEPLDIERLEQDLQAPIRFFEDMLMPGKTSQRNEFV
jgi:AcrR family transcriptional regulator